MGDDAKGTAGTDGVLDADAIEAMFDEALDSYNNEDGEDNGDEEQGDADTDGNGDGDDGAGDGTDDGSGDGGDDADGNGDDTGDETKTETETDVQADGSDVKDGADSSDDAKKLGADSDAGAKKISRAEALAQAKLALVARQLGYDSVDEYLAESLGKSAEEIEAELAGEVGADDADGEGDSDSKGDGEKKAPVKPAVDYAALVASDLAEIRAAFPAFSGLKTLAEIDNVERFAALRAQGVTAKEAFAATNITRLAAAEAAGARRKAEGKNHIRSVGGAGVSSVPAGDGPSPAEMRELKNWLPDKSDAEIRRYYKRIHSAT